MQPSAKYHIHAEIRADGVVERSDVVGAIFGQTEGLLGDELDLRELQDSSRVGRIDVDIESEAGRSYGTVTIASALDRVETAVLAAALETIERVGPCRADCMITDIEDARAAKRRDVIDRASELLSAVERDEMAGERLVEEVRKRARVAEITEYEGFPAGPRVEDSDAIVVVEGRADVRQLLEYGIKNAIAVEGTNVPEAVASLSHERNTTAFLDGDRGGDLILQELKQVGDLDYVAFAPANRSVEDLEREELLQALRKKVPAGQIEDGTTARQTFEASQKGSAADEAVVEISDVTDENTVDATEDANSRAASTDVESEGSPQKASMGSTAADEATEYTSNKDSTPSETATTSGEHTDRPAKPLSTHVDEVLESDVTRLLGPDGELVDELDSGAAFEAMESADPVPRTVIIDGPITQRLVDVAAQRGIGQLIGTERGDFVKLPTSVRVRTASELGAPDH